VRSGSVAPESGSVVLKSGSVVLESRLFTSTFSLLDAFQPILALFGSKSIIFHSKC